ncbi:sugar ABC transporter ATP-binding protein [Oscillospiraceae bacterium MB08-C2-2]|nr:sugar ABC transporter ATP-binding protein [Oscillospiraceae bacterium MB08-C2-2]
MLVEMKNISMDFGPVRALNNVSFTVGPSEIHGLLGENGAGKSTLMNILAGSFLPSEGEIWIDGRGVVMDGAKTANHNGIRFIHQELNLCNDLTVFENLFLTEEIKTKLGFLDRKAMIERTASVFQRMKVSIDPTALVADLEASKKQMAEIAKALLFDCKLIIMDEPTTSLTSSEIEVLFEIMNQLKAEGVSFIYISHKMPEIFEVCDRYTVLRDGTFIQSGQLAEMDEHRITELLIGKSLVDADLKEAAGTAVAEEVVLSLEGLSGSGFSDIDLELHRGEVVAITGLQGSGSSQLVDALFGAAPIKSGRILLDGKPVNARSNIRSRMRGGLALVPRNRKERGILTDLSIYDNLSMGFFNTKHKRPFISKKEETQRFSRQKEALAIKTDHPSNPITSLSGGNQQKVILARWLETDADVFLLDNPTQGIDVGSKHEIYKLILSLAKQGKALIVFTKEFPELYKVADRCVVLYKGKINARLERDELDESTVMYYSTGSNLEVTR